MRKFADKLSSAGLAGRVFNERQLADVLGGTKARRYGLVNRALKDGSLIRVKRGLYLLSGASPDKSVHPFAVAQALMPGSYVSFESALSFHGWIPEGVFTTASVTPGRKSLEHQHDQLGRFAFYPLALNDYQFLVSVSRVKFGQRTALVASPLRALMDLVARRKEPWSGLGLIKHGLRIEEAYLSALRDEEFEALKDVYRHKAARRFLEGTQMAVADLKSTPDPIRETARPAVPEATHD